MQGWVLLESWSMKLRSFNICNSASPVLLFLLTPTLCHSSTPTCLHPPHAPQFRPLEQLMGVFPSASSDFLPVSWRDLMSQPVCACVLSLTVCVLCVCVCVCLCVCVCVLCVHMHMYDVCALHLSWAFYILFHVCMEGTY